MKKITLPFIHYIRRKTKKDKRILVWLNWYRNAHYIESNNVKHYYHQLIKEQVGDVKLEQIKLEYKIYLHKKNIDYMNIRSIMEKFFLDWLVVNWNLKDDNFLYVKGDKCEVFYEKENPRIEIFIYLI